MRYQVRWTEDAIIHIARHALLVQDVEEALRGPVYARRVGTVVAITGRCAGGVLHVVLSPSPDATNTFEVITARKATFAEKRLFWRRGK